ncbi:hypothetical protein P280DRAFT_397701 [Massarina eburnea CBS 473.64]|uniref:DUF4484 domain-containing protein n=1 Tax=Massarina eburnea CBS 473.64 TaxID=1395130 RepID=A0A6A6S3A3_9PLEO|nr:hypothetical protein P280DRAFT_397701 [Massarina eburnea CBS 473.64]
MSSSSSSSATDVDGAENEPPRLSALFLIRFDKKVGYTIAWKRTAVDGLELDGAVEFKSLPSGLHTVDSDLVYFVHGDYAGLGAYVKASASAEERNAEFVSVGILVSRAYGRLGRSWLLAPRLRSLATSLANDLAATAPLEELWEEQSASTPSASHKGDEGHGRARALSTITPVTPTEQSLAPFHPALSMLKYVDVFGPLLFRLQQAALLRKRILFVGGPPVRTCCEFGTELTQAVYNLSLLSSIPPHLADFLSPGTDTLLRLPALFSVGVHDIPQLEQLSFKTNATESDGEDGPSAGWVACTTDEIITTKKQLYDVVVEMPPTYDAPPEQRVWPTMKTSDGSHIKASQRDLRRYKMLCRELWRHRDQGTGSEPEDEDEDDQAVLLPHKGDSGEEDLDGTFGDSVVEPITWTQLAYTGFMWWASAGEQHAYTSRERDSDLDLLGDLSDGRDGLPPAVIAYFHRSTSLLVNSLHGLIESADDENADDEGVLVVDKDDISRMGLDTWSEADKAFLSEFLWMWFGRTVEVRGTSIDCCGVRIPVP